MAAVILGALEYMPGNIGDVYGSTDMKATIKIYGERNGTLTT
jgi:hypothetical protein